MPTRLRRPISLLMLAILSFPTLALHPAQPSLAPKHAVTVPFQVPPPASAARSLLSSDEILVAHIYFRDLSDRDRLAAEYDAIEAPTTGGYVTALMSQAEFDALVAAGYRVEIDESQTALLNAPPPGGGAQTQGIPGYECYRTVEETYEDLSALAALHPTLATWNDMGDSWDKVTAGDAPGYDLNVLVLTNQAIAGPKPVFYLIAAIHAREYVTAELATRFAEYLLAGYGLDPDVTWLLDHFEIHIVPQVNPDGRKIAETGEWQRKNTNDSNGGSCSPFGFDHPGIDLNRNSTFHWNNGGSSSVACAETYRGPSAGSEPETQAIQAYALAHLADQRGALITDTAPAESEGLFITLHSYGRMVLFPWGDTDDPAPNLSGLQTLGRKFGFYNGHQVCQPSVLGCLYVTSGTTDDFIYGELGVAAFTFELGTTFFESCAYFEATILPANLPALVYAAKAARRPYQSPAGPESLQVSVSISSVVPGQTLTLTALADDSRYDSNGHGVEATQTISAARYSLETPSWVSGTVTYPLTAVDSTFDQVTETVTSVLDTTGWALGRHLVFVESQDADGNWGVPSAVFVWVVEKNYLPLINR